MNYRIIATGSKGNCLYVDSGDFKAIIDVGVPYKRVEGFDFDYVLLTHKHSDHFNPATCRKIVWENPQVKFLCSGAMMPYLVDAGVPIKNVFGFRGAIKVKGAVIQIFRLTHDVPNYGYKIKTNEDRFLYATDTATMEGIEAKDFDYYFIEANYDEDTIWERVKRKKLAGEYVYEARVPDTHLSIQQARKWLVNNAGANSTYIFMHQHQEEE